MYIYNHTCEGVCLWVRILLHTYLTRAHDRVRAFNARLSNYLGSCLTYGAKRLESELAHYRGSQLFA
jgi:hypothetical protein